MRMLRRSVEQQLATELRRRRAIAEATGVPMRPLTLVFKGEPIGYVNPDYTFGFL